MMLFIYDVQKERWKDDHKILGNFADGFELRFERKHFSNTLDTRKFKKQISSFST